MGNYYSVQGYVEDISIDKNNKTEISTLSDVSEISTLSDVSDVSDKNDNYKKVSKIMVDEIIQKGYDKNEENGIYGNVWNFRKQLKLNEQLMSLEDPNIPDYDIEVLEKLLMSEPYDLNQARFLQLHSSDLLERQISPNVEFWIQNNFLYLTKYKHK